MKQTLPVCLHVLFCAAPIAAATAPPDTLALGYVRYLQQADLPQEQAKNGQAYLYFNATCSRYVQTGAPAQTVVHEAPDGTLVSTAGDPQGFPMFKDHRTNQIVYRTKCYRKDWGNHCLVTDTLATIAWTIDPSAHKRFGPYDCQKATGAFRGRTYDVWFAPELPIPSGPFKLGGLPGLILEAQSQDGLVRFLFDGLELTPDAKTPIRQPEGYPTQLDFGQFNQSRYENTLESVRNFSLQQGGVPYKVFVPQGECIEYSNVKEK